MNCRILSMLAILIFFGASCRPSPSKGIESKTMDAGLATEFRISKNILLELAEKQSTISPKVTSIRITANERKETYDSSKVSIFQQECITSAFTPSSVIFSNDSIKLEYLENDDNLVSYKVEYESDPNVDEEENYKKIEADVSKILQKNLEDFLSNKLNNGNSGSSECKELYKELFTRPSSNQNTSNFCNSSNLKVPIAETAPPNCTCNGGGSGEYLKLEVKHVDSNYKTYHCVTVGQTPPIEDPDCDPTTGYNSLEEMNNGCFCDPSIRPKVEPHDGGIKIYCQNDPNAPPTGNNKKTYEIYFAIDQSDGCNQLSIEGPSGNLLPTTTPVTKDLSEAPSVNAKIPEFSHNCAKIHGGNSCGVISASPKVLSYRAKDGSSTGGVYFEHRTLNHNFCGTTPPPPPPEGDTCSLTGSVADANCYSGRQICAQNADNGNWYYCTNEKSSPEYRWLNCSSDSTCGGRN